MLKDVGEGWQLSGEFLISDFACLPQAGIFDFGFFEADF
jgi:hypothetical protein